MKKLFRFRLSSPILLVILASTLILGIGLSIFGLRHNNLRLISLTEAVVVADKNGQDTAIELALGTLRSHVIHHMNANFNRGSSLQLPHKYYRDTMALYESEVKKLNNDGSLVLLRIAGDACRAEIATIGVGCVQQYIADNPQAQGHNQLQSVIENINTNLESILPQAYYRFSYTSPGWSPDLAGFSIVLAVSSLLGLIATIIVRTIIRRRQQADDS